MTDKQTVEEQRDLALAHIDSLNFALCYLINNSAIQTGFPTECEIAEKALLGGSDLNLQAHDDKVLTDFVEFYRATDGVAASRVLAALKKYQQQRATSQQD